MAKPTASCGAQQKTSVVTSTRAKMGPSSLVSSAISRITWGEAARSLSQKSVRNFSLVGPSQRRASSCALQASSVIPKVRSLRSSEKQSAGDSPYNLLIQQTRALSW